MKAFAVTLCATLLFAGCISERRGSVQDDAGQSVPWQVGQTTPRDVVALWGNPDFVIGETWVWWNIDALGGKFRAAYMGVGVTVSNLRQGMSEYRLTFGADGKLKSLSAQQTLPGGPSWSVNPID